MFIRQFASDIQTKTTLWTDGKTVAPAIYWASVARKSSNRCKDPEFED